VSQYLIQRVIYPTDKSFEVRDLFFRVLLFKLFNRIDTWELLEEEVGPISWTTFSFDRCDQVLTRAIDTGRRIYSAAYIMPACTAMAEGRKHRGHLRLLEWMIQGGAAERHCEATTMAESFASLRECPMLGDFLAFQYTIDLNYGPHMFFSESDFVVPGPGAKDGLRKIFADPGDYSDADLIRWITDRQEQEFERLGLPFRTLWGRRLQLIDCQNLFCEVGKYARVHHPEVEGHSGRTRIKQRFSVSGPLSAPWFPPKWGLNDLIARDQTVAYNSDYGDQLFPVSIGPHLIAD
jgi:hypothetical protein